MRISLILLFSCLVFTLPLRAAPEVTLASLKAQLAKLQKQIEWLEQQQKQQSTSPSLVAHQTRPTADIQSDKVEKPGSTDDKTLKVKEHNKNTFRAYATIRPTFGYLKQGSSGNTDVRDALSHAGFKATREIMPGWSAEMQGEWGIDLSNNGDFGKSRRAYVALNSPMGRVGIGKQRPPQYLLIAEYVDIFNHAASPFSYDPESLFFVDNLVTYRKQMGDVTWMMAGQFNGSQGDENNDLFNAGVSYDKGDLHLALTYLTQDHIEQGIHTGNDKVIGAAAAYTFANNLYLAAGFQDREYLSGEVNQRQGHTFDVSAAYPFLEQYRLKLGYFDYDDGFSNPSSQSFDGVNATVEWLPAPGLRFHLEYLTKDFEQLDRFWSWSVGFRYDLSREWSF